MSVAAVSQFSAFSLALKKVPSVSLREHLQSERLLSIHVCLLESVCHLFVSEAASACQVTSGHDQLPVVLTDDGGGTPVLDEHPLSDGEEMRSPSRQAEV